MNRRPGLPLTPWLLVAAAVVAIAAASDAALWWRDAGRNAQIASGQVPADSAVPELQFAHAQALTAALGPGGSANPGQDAAAIDAALAAWRPLQAHPRLGVAARYNSANLLLRQAIALRSAEPATAFAAAPGGQALPLIELAKEQYRELLRRDPGFWDARYNLERAQRLLPDPVDSELEPTAAQRERERAASRMRAQSLGLP